MTASLTIQSSVSIDVDSILDTIEKGIPLARQWANFTPTPWDNVAVDGLEAFLASEPLRKFLRGLFTSDVPPLMALSSEPIPYDVKVAAAQRGISIDQIKKIVQLAIKLLMLFG